MALPATDDFADNEAPLATNWTTIETSLKALSGECYPNAGTGVGCSAYWDADSFNNDQYAQCELGTLSPSMGPLVRAAAAATTYYLFWVNSATQQQIYEVTAGSFTVLGSNYDMGLGAGDTVKLEVSGTTITPYKNGVAQATRTDSSIASGSAGLRIYDSVSVGTIPTLDNFEGGNLGAATTSPGLFMMISEVKKLLLTYPLVAVIVNRPIERRGFVFGKWL